MWGNLFADKEYYDSLVCPLFSKVFEKKVVPHEKKSNSVYGFYLCDKEIVRIFREIGFTRNKTYSVKVPKEVLNSKDPEILSAFVRGYADCDGCISFMKRKGKYNKFKLKFNTYPRVHIVSVSKQVMDDISSMLNSLNVQHTLYKSKAFRSNEQDRYTLTVRGVKKVEDWMDKIGFDNPAQMSKYLVWKKFGMCPPKLSHEKRVSILNGEISPFF